MAKVVYSGKSYEVSDIKLVANNDQVEIALCIGSTEIERLSFDNQRPVKFKITGDVHKVKVTNSVVVHGNVMDLRAGNCLYLKGLVSKFEAPNNIIRKMSESDMHMPDINKTFNGKKARVFTVEGNLERLVDSVQCGCLIYDIVGCVTYLQCDNCAYVEGDIGSAVVSNTLCSTFGLHEQVEEKIRREQKRKEQSEDYDKLLKGFDDMINEIARTGK